MKTALVIILLTFLQSSSFAQEKIKYYLTNNGNYPEDSELKAVIDKQTYTLIDKNAKICKRIENIGDFDNDGYEDILVEIINGCGGNCCGDSYQFFSFNGKDFTKSEQVGYDWNGIETSKTSGGYKFIIETINEGFNNDLCNNKIETFILKNHKLKLVNVVNNKMKKAISEIKSADFEGAENEVLYLTYDLDKDEKADTISCTYWARWGRIGSWNIKFGNGKLFEGKSSPKRVGIMNTKTNNVYDLIIECDEILKWDGTKYN